MAHPTVTARPTMPHATRSATPRRHDKDQPLIADIRLLGRLLGDVIREHEGAAT